MTTAFSAESEDISAKQVSVNLAGATIVVDDSSGDASSDEEVNELTFPHSVIPSNTNVNVDSSNDVVVGTITQFHAPVTIYQNTYNTHSDSPTYITNGSADEASSTGNSVGKLVAAESLPGKANVGEIQISRKKATVVSFVCLLFLLIVAICVIISIVVGMYINNENNQFTTPNSEQPETETQTQTQTQSQSQSQSQLPSRHKLISRKRWGGREPLFVRPMKPPVKYVIISHTVGKVCSTLAECSATMVQIQSMHVAAGSPDIGYNFVIGGDELIYIGRGWDGHNFHMNIDSIGICFTGNYIYDILTPGMIEAAQQLLKIGVAEGKLDKDYTLVAHNQTYKTLSPGPNIYKQIKYWPHFSPALVEDIE